MVMHSGSAKTLFETILVEEIWQNKAIVLWSDNISRLLLTSYLINCCIKSISHLQTLNSLIIKSCHSS